MNIYGYCRISTAKQSIDRQIRNIKAEYPTAHIVQEAYTGTSIFRPEWLKLYRILKSGDTVVFDSVSRMSRNAEEGFALYEDLFSCFLDGMYPIKPINGWIRIVLFMESLSGGVVCDNSHEIEIIL